METIKADLVIELNAECPHCEHYFDLISQLDLLELIFANSKINREIECDTECPNCKKAVFINGLNW